MLAFQAQERGPAPKEEAVAIDGKAARRSRGEQLLNAVSVPSATVAPAHPEALSPELHVDDAFWTGRGTCSG